jgi:alanyl-tRNA synthetase
LVEENKELRRQVRALEEVAAGVEAEKLFASAALRDLSSGSGRELSSAAVQDPSSGSAQDLSSGSVQDHGTRVVAHVFEARNAEFLQRVAITLIANPRTIALLGSREKDAARLVFARSSDTAGDMSALMREACTLLDGRGGGKPEMAQGGGKNVAKLQEAIDNAAQSLLGS